MTYKYGPTRQSIRGLQPPVKRSSPKADAEFLVRCMGEGALRFVTNRVEAGQITDDCSKSYWESVLCEIELIVKAVSPLSQPSGQEPTSLGKDSGARHALSMLSGDDHIYVRLRESGPVSTQ